MKISHIVAIDEKRGIAKNNECPWCIPEDLLIFKKLTNAHTVVMGKNTFLNIGKPLKNRLNIIVSSSLKPMPGIIVVDNFENAKLIALKHNEKELFVIGGQRLYYETLPEVSYIYMTHIFNDFSCDTFYPTNGKNWNFKLVQDSGIKLSSNGYSYAIKKYERIELNH